MAKKPPKVQLQKQDDYAALIKDISGVLESVRKASVRSINALLTTAYWSVGRRIIEFEYHRRDRSEYYGDRLIEKLAGDLSRKLGKGFSKSNLFLMKSFYLAYSNIFQTVSAQSQLVELSNKFSLPWSHYVRLLSVKDEESRKFYESEALCSGWSVRQLDRQISSQFYERTLLSKNKSAMLKKGEKPLPQDIVTVEEEIKDPFVLEFLGLKDEYSESDLEEALIKHKNCF